MPQSLARVLVHVVAGWVPALQAGESYGSGQPRALPWAEGCQSFRLKRCPAQRGVMGVAFERSERSPWRERPLYQLK
jgi:hypothetical protein